MFSGSNARTRSRQLCSREGNPVNSYQLPFPDEKQDLLPPCAASEPLRRSHRAVLVSLNIPCQSSLRSETFSSVKVAAFKCLHRRTVITLTELATFPTTFIGENSAEGRELTKQILGSCHSMLAAVHRNQWSCNSINQPRIWPVCFMKYSCIAMSPTSVWFETLNRKFGVSHGLVFCVLEKCSQWCVMASSSSPQSSSSAQFYSFFGQRFVLGASHLGKELSFLNCNKLNKCLYQSLDRITTSLK